MKMLKDQDGRCCNVNNMDGRHWNFEMTLMGRPSFLSPESAGEGGYGHILAIKP
jgi:hypothetical protein